MNIEYKEIPFGGAQYKSTIDLRYKVLRQPLGLVYDPAVLALETNDHHLCAFSESGALLACMIMTPVDNEIVKMRQFAVNPDFQSVGIGSGLVRYAEEWAKNSGFDRIELHARQSAVPFYLKLDYNLSGEEFIEVKIPHRFMFKIVVRHKG